MMLKRGQAYIDDAAAFLCLGSIDVLILVLSFFAVQARLFDMTVATGDICAQLLLMISINVVIPRTLC